MHRHHRNREPQSPAVAALSGIFAVCFGIFWTVMAGTIFPPMALFGILWTAIAGVTTYNSFKKAKENSEKAHEHAGFDENENVLKTRAQKEELRCPYCGAPIHSSDQKCEYCDSRL